MIDSSWYIKPAGVRESASAGGVIARREGQRVLVALVHERENADYILPKGKIEPGEASEAAARREIEEEAGFTDLRYIADLGIHERFNFEKTDWKRIHYYLYSTTQVESRPTDPYHDYHSEWFPIEALPPMFWPEQRQLIQGNYEMIVDLIQGRVEKG